MPQPPRKRKHAKAEVGDPYADGWGAALAGATEQINPHTPDSKEHRLWRDGWRAAKEDSFD